MVLIVILLVVLVVRTVKEAPPEPDGSVGKAKAPPTLARISRSVPSYGGQSKAEAEAEAEASTDSVLIADADSENKDYLSGEIEATSPLPRWLRRAHPDTSGFGSKGDLIDLNTADSAALEALPGIGPVLSVRIIKYRYLLGNFHNIDQLNDVYGLDKEVIELNRHRLRCDTSLLRKVYINTSSFSQLVRHPYLDKAQAKAILTYRSLCGRIKNNNELILNRILTATDTARLGPYLVF